MPKKKPSFDYFKLIPIGVLAFSFVSGYTLLQSRVGNTEEKVKKHEEILEKQSDDTSKVQIQLAEVKVSQKGIEDKVDLIYEAIKDLKK